MHVPKEWEPIVDCANGGLWMPDVPKPTALLHPLDYSTPWKRKKAPGMTGLPSLIPTSRCLQVIQDKNVVNNFKINNNHRYRVVLPATRGALVFPTTSLCSIAYRNRAFVFKTPASSGLSGLCTDYVMHPLCACINSRATHALRLPLPAQSTQPRVKTRH